MFHTWQAKAAYKPPGKINSEICFAFKLSHMCYMPQNFIRISNNLHNICWNYKIYWLMQGFMCLPTYCDLSLMFICLKAVANSCTWQHRQKWIQMIMETEISFLLFPFPLIMEQIFVKCEFFISLSSSLRYNVKLYHNGNFTYCTEFEETLVLCENGNKTDFSPSLKWAYFVDFMLHYQTISIWNL